MRFEFSLMSTLFVNTSLDSFFSVCVRLRDASANARVSITGTAAEEDEVDPDDAPGIVDVVSAPPSTVVDVVVVEIVDSAAALVIILSPSLPCPPVVVDRAPSSGLLIVRLNMA